MNYFLNLIEKGYYLSIAKSEYNGAQFTEYAMLRDESDNTRSIACYINLCAKRMLVKAIPHLPVSSSLKTNCWLNRPESLDFYTHTKEP